jgi:hypothetical protein
MVAPVNTDAPVLQYVHVDHLHRPVKMTNSAKAVLWDASVRSTTIKSVAAGHAEGMQTNGGPHSLTGTGTLSARFRFCLPASGGTPVVPGRNRLA